MDPMNVDNMLALAGDFHRYQFILLCIFSIINILSALHYFGQTFISVKPDFDCVENFNTTVDHCRKRIYKNGKFIFENCNEWIYNNTNIYGFISIVEELNWVCSDSWKPAIGQSIFFIGSVFGTLLFGVLSDIIGRLHVLIASNLLASLGNLLTVLSSNIIFYSFSRFLAGCATDANFVMIYIIVMEYIRPSLRTISLNLCIGIFYCLACTIVPWLAVLFGNWKYFLILVSMPHLSVLICYFIVPESAQWLISKGKIDEATICFKRIAKINKKEIEDQHLKKLKLYYTKTSSKNSKQGSLLDLLKTPNLRRKTLILIFKSMVMTLCYDAISRDLNGIGYSPFLVFSVTSITILPACIFILLVQDKFGRKALASGALLFTGLFTGVSGLLQALYSPQPVYIICLKIISRLGINVAYNSGAQYAVELIPTVVRGQGVSAIHVAGYAASFLSPQILYLSNFWKPAPDLILGSLLILGAIFCLFLPETLNKVLPVSLEDAEKFGEDEKVFEFSCGKNK